jgi:uncharacterized membrane protein HdeD (DUF308 family)
MVQMVLILLGVEAIQHHWKVITGIGLSWTALGLFVIVDPLEGMQSFTMHSLGLLLAIEGVIGLLLWMINGRRRRLSLIRAAALIVLGLEIMDTPFRNTVLISFLFGFALTIDGLVRLTTTLMLRFPGWRLALVGSVMELVLAGLAFTPWPVSYEATVPFCVGVALMLSGWTVLRTGLLLRHLPPDAPVTSLPIFRAQRGWHPPALTAGTEADETVSGRAGPRMIVHVWTPVGGTADPVRNPLLNRYIAAVDRQGVISTGHAALEMPPDLYISHYRATGNERDQSEFIQALNAGAHNDSPGRFLPNYKAEVGDWWEATEHIVFRRFSARRLRRFWEAYRQDSTYNLTNRNCSVVVALALDAALEGVIGAREGWLRHTVRLVMHPDLYLATVLRKRALTMTWTPGLVLDYARALHRVIEPPKLSWPDMVRQALRAHRRQRRVHQAASLADRVTAVERRSAADQQPRSAP